jgi:hypothetical protein
MNVSKVVKYSKVVHLACPASWRVAYNIAELLLIAFDYVVFGEYVSSCREVDYDVYGKATDIIAEFTDG